MALDFLFIDTVYAMGSTAWRLKLEGFKVALWHAKGGNSWKGLLPQARNDWGKRITPETVIVFDMVGGGKLAARLKGQGYPILGAGRFNDAIELERDFGTEIAKQAGLAVPETVTFSQYPQAQKFLDSQDPDSGWVFKPNGNVETSLTFVADSPADLLATFPYLQHEYPSGEFLLQKVVKGVEVSTEGWFLGNHWASVASHTLERKRLFDRDLGPNTGCQGNVVWACNPKTDPIFRATLGKLTKTLTEARYFGPLDVNCIVSNDDRKPYFLEFTARFGYDAWQTFQRLLAGWVGDFMRWSVGLEKTEPVVIPGYATGIRITTPPYPNEPPGDPKAPAKMLPLSGLRPEDLWGAVHLSYPVVDKDVLFTADKKGHVAVATGVSDTPDGSVRAAYNVADRIRVPDKQMRSDMGEQAIRDLDRLRSWGAAPPIQYPEPLHVVRGEPLSMPPEQPSRPTAAVK